MSEQPRIIHAPCGQDVRECPCNIQPVGECQDHMRVIVYRDGKRFCKACERQA